MANRILFVLKKRQDYSEGKTSVMNSGLFTSANMVVRMLLKSGTPSRLAQVVDNNDIDRVVTSYKPNIVIIEALWVVPEKFEVLKKLHPNVTWVVRLHSELPFIANEGIAFEWLNKLAKMEKVSIAVNSKHMKRALERMYGISVHYLPNYYELDRQRNVRGKNRSNELNIGCFGAIRPMKNHLTQAIAAIMYANEVGKKLRFHINSNRVEQNGNNVLKNIRSLFAGTDHKLIEHGWLNHDDFLDLVSRMDLGLQVSMSETYNIVTADFVGQYIPVVTCSEIPFVNPLNKISSVKDAEGIRRKIKLALRMRGLRSWNLNKLLANNGAAAYHWQLFTANN